MSDHFDAIVDSVKGALAASPAPTCVEISFDPRGWSELDQLGFTNLALPAALGGSDGNLKDAATACKAGVAAAFPLIESNFLAVPALTAAGVPWPGGVVTAATTATLISVTPQGTLSGRVTRIPWLRNSDYVVLIFIGDKGPQLAVIDPRVGGASIEPGTNIAGEPRDTLELSEVRPATLRDLPPEWDGLGMQYGAAGRAVQIAAAGAAVLESAARHTSERNQFGRPLVKFQTVQHQLAQLTGDVVTIATGSEAAVLALCERTPQAELLVASAKAESSILTRRITAVGHQLHGAMGFTTEHKLGAYTTRMWSWREEFGSEMFWQNRIADLVALQDDDVWGLLSDHTLAVGTELNA